MATRKSKSKSNEQIVQSARTKILQDSYPKLAFGEHVPVGDLTPRERRLAKIVEFQLYISPRGRSVVTGSMLIEGRVQSFKHELDHAEKVAFLDVLVYVLNVSAD